MKFSISGKNITVTKALREHVEKKIGKISKYFEKDIEAIVTLSVERDRHIAEVTVPLNGMILRGETETQDMYSSIDMVVDKLEKQIDKYKTKVQNYNKKSAMKANHIMPKTSRPADENEPRVVKVKRFALKPMDIEEAVLQMNLLGHDFFVFSNADTDEVNVVYKRKDGNYGLIEPELL